MAVAEAEANLNSGPCSRWSSSVEPERPMVTAEESAEPEVFLEILEKGRSRE